MDKEARRVSRRDKSGRKEEEDEGMPGDDEEEEEEEEEQEEEEEEEEEEMEEEEQEEEEEEEDEGGDEIGVGQDFSAGRPHYEVQDMREETPLQGKRTGSGKHERGCVTLPWSMFIG